MSDDARHNISGEEHTAVNINKPSTTANNSPEDPTISEDTTNNINTSSTSSRMANGLSHAITTIINEFDTQAQQTSRSQDQLSSAIDRLTNELDQLLADAPSPFIMQHAAKISGVRKRVSSLNSVLKSIQRRVDNIDRLVSAGLPHDEIASESPAEQ